MKANSEKKQETLNQKIMNEEKMNMQDRIIDAAGKIWGYLNTNGEVTAKKMQKDLSLDDNMAYMGLGWLSREDKINYQKRGNYTKISLR